MGAGGKGDDDDEKMTAEEEREARAAKRTAKRTAKAKKMESMDALSMAQRELGSFPSGKSAGGKNAKQQQPMEDDDDIEDAAEEEAALEEKFGGGAKQEERSKLGMCMDWIFETPKPPKKEWQTFRKEEITEYLKEMRRGILYYMPKYYDTMMFRKISRRKLHYWGEFDSKGERDGRGVCLWPDPPKGGGESYHGLWRGNQPNGHGLFRWYDGDTYLGEWNAGMMQGYGVYKYGPEGTFAKDVYQGTYFNGLRQGTGVYKYAPKGEDEGGAVYMGEWLRGTMHGNGLLVYADGETYIGQWKLDKKDGFGQYIWGHASGEVAGDKFLGEFREGYTHGLGKTVFADGGNHRGEYARGKMNGHGVLRVADGWEYTGQWKDDELHGEVVCYYAFGAGQGKEVQIYDEGNYVESRAYDPSVDWGEIESVGMSEARNAEKAADEAQSRIATVQRYGKRAKESQALAKDSAEEARYMTSAALSYKEFLQNWYGIKHYIIAEEV